MIHEVKAPLSVPISKNKHFILNLNKYRNTYYQTLNKAKIEYKNAVQDQVLQLPKLDTINIDFWLYPKNNRSVDIDNVLSIHAKFFLDALVELGKLPDDNSKYVTDIGFHFGEVKKDDPSVVIYIEDNYGN